MTNPNTATTADARTDVARPAAVKQASNLWVAAMAYTTIALFGWAVGTGDSSSFLLVALGLGVVIVQLVIVRQVLRGSGRARTLLSLIAGVSVAVWVVIFIQHVASPQAMFDLFAPVVLIVGTALLWSPASKEWFRRTHSEGAETR